VYNKNEERREAIVPEFPRIKQTVAGKMSDSNQNKNTVRLQKVKKRVWVKKQERH
jgi:hypothetical protein